MNYIKDKSFVQNELTPLLRNMITDYVHEEAMSAESVEDLDEIGYMNCPEDLMDEIVAAVNGLIVECLDDYDIITLDENEFRESICMVVEDIFEDVKDTEIDMRRYDFEKLDYFEEFE